MCLEWILAQVDHELDHGPESLDCVSGKEVLRGGIVKYCWQTIVTIASLLRLSKVVLMGTYLHNERVVALHIHGASSCMGTWCLAYAYLYHMSTFPKERPWSAATSMHIGQSTRR
jgi:hypothetical protein